MAGDSAGDQLLVDHRTVELGGVQEVDAELQRPVDGGDRLALVGLAVERRHAHAAEAEAGDLEAGQRYVLHGAEVTPEQPDTPACRQ